LVAGLGKEKDTDRIRSAFEASEKVITAWMDGNLVGAGRMITDGVSYGLIVDVGVWPSFQKQGLGKGIMKHLLEDSRHLSLQLWPTKGNIPFYEKFGFTALGPDHPVMIIKRSQ